MLLSTFDPFAEFHRALRTGDSGHAAMRMDAVRREQEVELRFDLPGIDTDSIDVTVDRGVLTVCAKRSEEHSEGEKPFVRERIMGSFTRRIRLSDSVDAENISAALRRRRLAGARPAPGARAAAQGRGQHCRHGRSRGLIGAVTCEGPGRLRPARARLLDQDQHASTETDGRPAMAPLPLDDANMPLFTVGQVAEMLEVQQAFLRRLDEFHVVRPSRSAGGQRRYTRNEIVVVRYVVDLIDDGLTLSAVRRVLQLEARVRELQAERDELRAALAHRQGRWQG